jgi:23S rRNA A1618 N6-methylase RlmF
MTKKGGRITCPLSHERWDLVHFVHFLAATIRGRIIGLDGLEGVALGAHVVFVFLGVRRLGRAFAAAGTTAHFASSSMTFIGLL